MEMDISVELAEQHETAITDAIREQRAFTMLLGNVGHGEPKFYGVRYGVPHFPNNGGFWLS